MLIRELATIKFNYFLTTFKEIFNDVFEERRHIVNEERSKMMSLDRTQLMSRESAVLRTEDLRKSTSQVLLSERFRSKGALKDLTSSISSASPVMPMSQKAVLLTDLDQKQIDKMRQRNERFTQKLISDVEKKERYQNELIKRSKKHE